MNHAQYLTYPAVISTFAFAGLHLTEVCLVLSSTAAIVGAGCQFLAYLKLKDKT